MELRSKELAYFKQVFEKLVKNICYSNKQYYLKDSRQVYSELLLSFSKVYNLLYSNPMTAKFLRKFTVIYQHYNWILRKINPDSNAFSISNLSRLCPVLKELLLLIRDLIPLFYSIRHPTHDQFLTSKVQNIINTFKID